MPLLPVAAKPGRSDPIACDLAHAKKLRDAVVKAYRYNPRCSLAGWAKEFSLLRRLDVAGDGDRVCRAVDWYCRNVGRPYVPKPCSAEAFRKKFLNIEAAMARAAARGVVLAEVEVSDEAKSLSEHLYGLGWHKGSRDKVPAFVQATMDAVTGLRKRLKALLAALPPKHPLRGFVRHLQDAVPPAYRFVEEWTHAVHSRIGTWDKWNGDLTAQVFNPATKHGLAWGRGVASAYGGAKDWDAVLKLLDIEVVE